MTLTPDELQFLIRRNVFGTREDELACGECFARIDQFAEMKLKGLDAAAALPLVEDHLQRCRECQEEFTLLLKVLRSEAEGTIEAPTHG